MRLVVVLVLCAALGAGCGTVCNLARENPDNYGGVQRDLQFASDARDKGGVMAGTSGSTGAAYAAAAIVGLYCVDLSFSFIADTMTLPLAVYLRRKHEAATASESGSGS
jgi:uncharacterized protein YceK